MLWVRFNLELLELREVEVVELQLSLFDNYLGLR